DIRQDSALPLRRLLGASPQHPAVVRVEEHERAARPRPPGQIEHEFLGLAAERHRDSSEMDELDAVEGLIGNVLRTEPGGGRARTVVLEVRPSVEAVLEEETRRRAVAPYEPDVDPFGSERPHDHVAERGVTESRNP